MTAELTYNEQLLRDAKASSFLADIWDFVKTTKKWWLLPPLLLLLLLGLLLALTQAAAAPFIYTLFRGRPREEATPMSTPTPADRVRSRTRIGLYYTTLIFVSCLVVLLAYRGRDPHPTRQAHLARQDWLGRDDPADLDDARGL